MVYVRPIIVPGQTRRNDDFYNNILDGVDEAKSVAEQSMSQEEADARYAIAGGAALPPGGIVGQVVAKTPEGGGWTDQPTVDTLSGASELGRSIMKAATAQLVRDIAQTPSVEDVEPTMNLTLAFENALA